MALRVTSPANCRWLRPVWCEPGSTAKPRSSQGQINRLQWVKLECQKGHKWCL